jgi:hypothetical protein
MVVFDTAPKVRLKGINSENAEMQYQQFID